MLGICTAFAGMIATMMGTIGIAMRLDRVWKLVRRAAGTSRSKARWSVSS